MKGEKGEKRNGTFINYYKWGKAPNSQKHKNLGSLSQELVADDPNSAPRAPETKEGQQHRRP